MQSFDIFDTLLTRKVISPKGIFVLMEQKLRKDADVWEIPVYYAKHFKNFRMEAEAECRNIARQNGKEEISLGEIYDVLAYMIGITDQIKEKLMELEIELEIENSLPIEENIWKLKEAAKYGDVALVSDMYLPGHVIRKMLIQADKIFETIPLVVSCEYGKTKASGKLFEVFLQEFQVNPSDWKHYGDNINSDGAMVSSLGGRFELYIPKEAYSDQILNSVKGYQQPEFEIMAGVANYLSDVEKTDAYNIGVKWATPILFGYVLWVIQQSVRQQIDHLFFVMRDGYIEKKIADVMIKCLGIPLHTHYLFGSRAAWDMQENSTAFGAYEDVINDLGSVNSSEKLPLSLIYKDTQKRYSPREDMIVKTIVDHVFTNKSTFEARIHRAKSYLRQELADIDGKIAFVEVNGSGKTQQFLKELCSGFFQQPVHTFYYTIAGIMYDYRNSDIVNQRYMYMIPACRNILEPLARAPYNRTIDYEYDTEKKQWIPKYCQNRKDYMDEKDFHDYITGIEECTKFLCSNTNVMSMDFSNVSRAFLDFLCWQPDQQVASFIGDMPFEGNVQKEGTSVYAPKLDDEELKQLFLYKNTNMMDSYFREANLQFSLLRLTEEQKKMVNWFNSVRGASYQSLNSWIPETISGRVVLYGAGIRGKRAYQYLEQKQGVTVTAWVDRDFQNINNTPVAVESPEKLKEMEYDYVLITPKNLKVIKNVVEFLLHLGVSGEKIL